MRFLDGLLRRPRRRLSRNLPLEHLILARREEIRVCAYSVARRGHWATFALHAADALRPSGEVAPQVRLTISLPPAEFTMVELGWVSSSAPEAASRWSCRPHPRTSRRMPTRALRRGGRPAQSTTRRVLRPCLSDQARRRHDPARAAAARVWRARHQRLVRYSPVEIKPDLQLSQPAVVDEIHFSAFGPGWGFCSCILPAGLAMQSLGAKDLSTSQLTFQLNRQRIAAAVVKGSVQDRGRRKVLSDI